MTLLMIFVAAVSGASAVFACACAYVARRARLDAEQAANRAETAARAAKVGADRARTAQLTATALVEKGGRDA